MTLPYTGTVENGTINYNLQRLSIKGLRLVFGYGKIKSGKR